MGQMKSMMMLWMICLSSCRSYPKIEPQFSKDIRIEVAENGSYIGRCRLRCLNLMNIKSPAVDLSECDETLEGDGINLPLEDCNQLVGFDAEDYKIDIQPWLIEMRQYCIDKNDKNSH